MRSRALMALILALPATAVAVAAPPAAAAPIVQLSAPPMGWNSWNRFGCNITEGLIRGIADAIVANNLDDLGYRYVNIDDCWMANTWLASSNGWGPAERNESNGEQPASDGRTLTINGTTYANGIGAHADSAVHVWLGRACTRFTAQVGVDDEVTTTGSVRFQVYGDGRLLGYSDVKTSSAGPSTLTVTTTGYATLELRVTDGRNGIAYDHADWGAATLTC